MEKTVVQSLLAKVQCCKCARLITPWAQPAPAPERVWAESQSPHRAKRKALENSNLGGAGTLLPLVRDTAAPPENGAGARLRRHFHLYSLLLAFSRLNQRTSVSALEVQHGLFGDDIFGP